MKSLYFGQLWMARVVALKSRFQSIMIATKVPPSPIYTLSNLNSAG